MTCLKRMVWPGWRKLGLHQKENFDAISAVTRFTFAHNDVASTQRLMLDNNYHLLLGDLDNDDHVQHCLFASPSQLGCHILAARPFSPLSETSESKLGYFRTYLVPNSQATDSIRFWENLGQLVIEDELHGIHVSSQNFNALIGKFQDLSQPALLFEHPDPESIFPLLARFGIAINMPDSGLPMGSHFSVRTADGIELIIKSEES